RGPWLHTILFEVPLLAVISELYMTGTYGPPDREEGLRRVRGKTARLREAVGFEDCVITDFGARRRYSHAWHGDVLPHRRAAFDTWAREYRGDLGVALTDVIGLDAFLRDFDLYFCKLFDGMRHDSGDPFEWGERIIAHLQAHRIDPRTKTLVFSDGLDIDRVMALYDHFRGRCRMSFGVCSNLTNDLGPNPLQIVLKMVRCNGQPVAKLSDSPGKTMVDDPAYLAYLRQVFSVE